MQAIYFSKKIWTKPDPQKIVYLDRHMLASARLLLNCA